LSRKPQHVYSLWKSLRERGLNISKTAVYLHVRELERLGYVVSEYVGRRKILKVSGKNYLHEGDGRLRQESEITFRTLMHLS